MRDRWLQLAGFVAGMIVILGSAALAGYVIAGHAPHAPSGPVRYEGTR